LEGTGGSRGSVEYKGEKGAFMCRGGSLQYTVGGVGRGLQNIVPPERGKIGGKTRYCLKSASVGICDKLSLEMGGGG